MFMLIQGVRSVAARLLCARLTAKAEKLADQMTAAGAEVKPLAANATAEQVATQVAARSRLQLAEAKWEPAALKAEKWQAKRARAVTPTSRVPAYLAGKLDAALLAFVAYPYVPAGLELVRKYLG